MELDYKSSSVIKKHPRPILLAKDIPYPSTLVYNAGVAKFEGKYVMVFRNDLFNEDKKIIGTNLGLAYSDDGINWSVSKKPCFEMKDNEIDRAYDPRLTVIDSRCYMCFAMDTKHGIRGGIAVTDDFEKFELLSASLPDNRNMVLFPEKIGGRYVRLERPMPMYSRQLKTRFDSWISYSYDLKYFGDSKLLMAVEDVPYANDKIGPGAPPVKTEKGWLCAFHAVDQDEKRGKNGWDPVWQKRYCAGIALLDLENPSKVLGIYKEPLIAPFLEHETNQGYRTHVIFPGGMILEPGGEVKIYYGAADTVECLATADVNDLIKLCLNS